jgi:hypothetical protein
MNKQTDAHSKENLVSLIQLHPNGLRSIQVENDLENHIIAENYVVTAQSRACLSRILLRIKDSSFGRSWTLTGPYGSGKSFFSLFLMNLASSAQSSHQNAINKLSIVDPVLSNQIDDDLNLNESKGLLPIAITGFRTSFQECLKQGFVKAIDRLRISALQSLSKELDSWTNQTDSRTVIQWIRSFKSIITSPENDYFGLLIVFDEMGKPLEYAASHPEETDIYLLQELGEFVNRSGDKPMVFIGILHQSFDRYATAVDQTARKEWTKVQGRFEDISFQEPFAQQTRLLARAIEPVRNGKTNSLVPELKQIAEESIEAGWCPSLMSYAEFVDICQVSYPFHPSTLVVIPYLFKRLAQNERSIFAYLVSYEPYGFQEFLRSHTITEFLRLPDLFDYLVANFQSKLYASNRARALTESLERLNSSSNLTGLEFAIVKTIGLLSWLSEVSTIQPTENLIISALVSRQNKPTEIRQALEHLKKQSIIVFRRFNHTYAIWQGSDVDLEERMEQAQRQVSGAFSLAEAVQLYLPPRPFIARRHSFQTGTLRFFEVRYVDMASLPKPGASGLLLLCLTASSTEISEFAHWAEQPLFIETDGILIGITKRTAHINELLYDLRCYHWIEENTPELRDDKTAQKELFTQINAIETLIQSELDETISLYNPADPTGCIWKYRGKDLPISSRDGISQVLSKICDQRYICSPKIRNELINRHQLSSQSAAARRNLIEAMLTKPTLPRMGISGYPPERSIYESLIAFGGLHRQEEPGKWGIVQPGIDDPLNLIHAWNAINDYIFIEPPETRPVVDLYKKLIDAPFGITEGVLPVLLCVFLQVNQDETTLYREGTLLAEPRVADWEVLLRRPDLFSVAGCRVTGTRSVIVERIAKGFDKAPKVMPIVRELVRQLKSLPEYAWKTNQISPEAIAVRRAIEMAQSPEKLLFSDLPEALGLPPIGGEQLDHDDVEVFFNCLNKVLSELATATPLRRDWARDEFLKSCELPEGAEGWQYFIEISLEMNGRITNPNLAILIKRSAEATDPTTALESVLALIANRPMRAWTDMDVDRYPMLAQSLGHLFVAKRNGYLPGLTLTQEEKQRSQALVNSLQKHITQMQEDPRVLQAALQKLVEFYRLN